MTTDTLLHPAIQGSVHRTQAEHIDQYTLWQILGIWASVAIRNDTTWLGNRSHHHSYNSLHPAIA